MRKDKPSRTAIKVALAIVTLGSKPGMEKILPSGIVDATAQLLVAAGVVGDNAVRWSRSSKMLRVYNAFEWLLPGQFDALGHRKAFCESQVREAINIGVSQILVLGAGFDTLCWRLATEFPDINFFEIDHPATARFKAMGIEAMGQQDNLYLIAEDLGERELEDVLEAHQRWNREKPTMIVAEGLVMYLPPEAVRELFCQCALISGDDSRIAFTYIPSGTDGRPDAGCWTGLMRWLQKVTGEPWLWSITPTALNPFLERNGWTVTPTLSNPSCKQGIEYFVVAEKKH